MPRDGAVTLMDLIPPRMTVALECTRCKRRGPLWKGSTRLCRLAGGMEGLALQGAWRKPWRQEDLTARSETLFGLKRPARTPAA